ncbi:MAG TPA: sensor histidine kinase [Ignavibacteriales bacterium]|nr:sensor histidine kinase [Ignavibacteriales bacterium]
MDNNLQNRINFEGIKSEFNLLLLNDEIRKIFEIIPNMAGLLNEYNQFVFYNKKLFTTLQIEPEQILSYRIGEILNCKNSTLTEDGCGTSEYCKFCGAFQAIEKSKLTLKPTSMECNIISHNDENIAYNLLVNCYPLIINDRNYTVIVLEDISAKKRKENFERIFFHDVLNTASGIAGVLDYLTEAKNDMPENEFIKLLSEVKNASYDLLEEIQAQKDLVAAENNNLIPDYRQINLTDLIQDIIINIKFHAVAVDKNIDFENNLNNPYCITSKVLLRRVILNMLKNALEASLNGEVVLIKAYNDNEYIFIEVHNNALIPENVKSQIFQRNYSTKAKDRGLGTYSMKLLAEKYLQGEISFISNEIDRTIFKLKIPQTIKISK